MIDSFKKPKRLVVGIAAATLTATLLSAPVQADLPIASKGRWYYNMGGSGAYSTFSSRDPFEFELGASTSFNIGDACNFNPSVSIQNYITDVERSIYGIKDAALSAVMSMIKSFALDLIQDANPGLYDMVTKNLAQANAKFEVAVKNCREMIASKEAGRNPWDDWITLSKSSEWSEASASGGEDPVTVQDDIDQKGGDKGATWVDGKRAGGKGQEPIRIVEDPLRVGWQYWEDKDPESRIQKVFGSDTAAVQYAHKVLGETALRTCVNCQRLTTRVGLGVKPQHKKETDQIGDDLASLVSSSDTIQREDIDKVSAEGMGLVVSAEVIEGLRDESPADQAILVGKLASEVALQRQVERMLILRHLFKAAMQDPHIAANEPAIEQLDRQLNRIQEALDEILWERKIRREIASETASGILARKAQRDKAADHILQSPEGRPSLLDPGEG